MKACRLAAEKSAIGASRTRPARRRALRRRRRSASCHRRCALARRPADRPWCDAGSRSRRSPRGPPAASGGAPPWPGATWRLFANLKAWALGVYHGLREKHLQSYLDEFVFRFNRRRTRHAAFRSLLGIAVVLKHVTYNMLIQPEAQA